MGRSRRRIRREGEGNGKIGADLSAALEPAEVLTPTYVSVGPTAWAAVSDTPVLEIEGLKPWDEIRAPALALVDEEAPVEPFAADSKDPSQLELKAEALPQPEAPPAPVEPAAAAAEPAAEPVVEPIPDVELPPPEPINQRLIEIMDAVATAEERAARGDQSGALAILDRMVEAEPEDPTLLTARGGLLGAMGRYAAAERDLKKVLRTEESHPDALFHLGVVLTKKGLWGEAVPHLRRAVELDPTRGPAYFYLGEALNHVDDLPGAMAAYQRASELMPDHPRSLYGLGIVFDRLGRPDDAARMYRKSRDVGRR